MYACSVFVDGGERTTHCCKRLKAFVFFRFILLFIAWRLRRGESTVQEKKYDAMMEKLRLLCVFVRAREQKG